MMTASDEILQKIESTGQQHLLRWWPELTVDQQDCLLQQISAVDFEVIQKVWQQSQMPAAEASETSDQSGICRADLAAAPKSVVCQPVTDEDRAQRLAAAQLGDQLLRDGNIAVITVAGGQGSRLGFEHPKGMYKIGPATDRTLFQIFAEQIQARKRRHGGEIPWLIMTSSATHNETQEFFEANSYFGLDSKTVFLFQQGSMPAVDAATGKLLMSDKCNLCLSPDGHGGLVTALKSSGLLDKMAAMNVAHFFYHQVDNPTVIMCDPELLGLHHQHQSQLSTNVVRKVDPMERMGVLVDMNGQIEIIEYSELNEEQASREDESGQWIFWAGNTAIHVFARSFFEELTNEGCHLELHLASKKVSHIGDDGLLYEPSAPNAYKFERFIFDALPLAKNALIVEGNRDREFNPVKNAAGSDSPATARAAMTRIYREWAESAGLQIDDDSRLEISPLSALDAEQLKARVNDGSLSAKDIMA